MNIKFSNLEYQYWTEGSVTQIYLLAVREEKDITTKDSVLDRVVLLVIKIFFSYSVAYFVSLWAIKAAYEQRGYEAYGGEYILILAAFVIAYETLSLFFKNFRRKKHGETRNRRTAWIQHNR